MKEGLGLLTISVLVIAAAAAYANDWEPPVGPDYETNPPANEFVCASDVRDYYREKSYSWAKEAAEYYVANYPLGRDIPEVTYILANCKLIAGDYEGVLEILESVMDYYPSSPFSTASADLYLALFVSGPKSPASKYRWRDFLDSRLGINEDDPAAVNQEKLFEARFEALNLAEIAYLKRMFYLSGAERDAAADANVANFITLMPYLGFEFAGDNVKEFKEKEKFLSSVEEKEMSREMRATVAFYRGILYAENYPVDEDDWPGGEAGAFYTWYSRERLMRAEDVWRRVEEEYPDTRAGLLAKTILIDYEVTLHGDPEKGANDFAELINQIENDDYAEYLEGVVEKLQAPSLAITHVRNDPRADPQITIDMAAKEYDAVNLAFYPVEPIHYRELGRELDAVDIYLNDGTVSKPDIGVTIPESRIGSLNAEFIDRVVARPTADLPGVGAPITERTIPTGYKGDLRISTFSAEIKELNPGLYIVEATTADGNTCRSLFLHSKVTAVAASFGDFAYLQLCDTANGEPIAITDVKAYVAVTKLVGEDYYDEVYEYVDLDPKPKGEGYLVNLNAVRYRNRKVHVVLDSDRGPAFIDIDAGSGSYYRYDEFGIIYTDRPLYNPGQTVNYKYILRSVDYKNQELVPIPDKAVTITVTGPRGDEVWTAEGITDEFGVLFGNFELPADVKLGDYAIIAEWTAVEKNWMGEHDAEWYFAVEEYEKPEYQLFLEREKDRYLSGEKIRLKAKGMYYFGAPMSDSKVEYVVTRTGHTDDEYDYRVVVKEGEGQTDADGEYVIEWRSKYSGKYESIYDVHVALTDPSNHEVDGDRSVAAFRSDRYVKITTDKNNYYSSDTIIVKLATHDWYEEPVSIPVTLRAFNVEERYDKDGRYKDRKKGKKLYETEVITVGDGSAEIPIELGNPGKMVVLEAEVKDTVGTKVTDTVNIEIIEETEETTERVPELEITVDEHYPALGDVVFATVRSRFEGITVGLLSSSTAFEGYENVTLEPDPDGGYSYTFPVYADRRFLPNLCVEANAFYEGEDYHDYVYVYIRNTDLELNVNVETSKYEYHPSDGKAVVSLTTTDDNGLPVVANVSVAAVDEALLALRQDDTGSIPEGYHRLLGRVRAGVYSKNSLKTMGDIKTATYKFLNYEGLDYSSKRMFGVFAEGKALDILKTFQLPAVPAEDAQLRFPAGYLDRFRPEIYDNTYVWEGDLQSGTGYISGLVTDENGFGISGALVVVKGANMFATTNADGYYVVNAVPAGYFDVKASRVGYSEMNVTGVKVVAALRTNVSFQLQSKITGEHHIEAMRPLIDFKITATTDTIDTYIVDEFADMLARTPGIVYEDSDADTLNLHIRGGRGDEIAYIVAGVGIINPIIPIIAQDILREFFADSAFWEPAVITDADGKAYVEIELPDNLTTWKVMALGVDKGQRIGWGCGDFKVTKNVIVRVKAPRHLVVGDTTEVKTIGHNYLDEAKNVTLLTECDELELAAGETEANRFVEAGGYEYTSGVYEAVEPGTAEIRALAGTDVESDAVVREIPVYPHGIVQRQSYAGRLRETATHDFFIPGAIDPVTFKGEITAASSLAKSLSHGLEYFETYPYNCVEQTLNRFLVNALLAESAGELGLDRSELSEGLDEAIADGIEMMGGQQDESGGWPWWRGGTPSPYMTAYALDGLYAIKDSPFLEESSKNAVDEMIETGSVYLIEYVNDLENDPDRYDRELTLYIADVAVRRGILSPNHEVLRDTLDHYFADRDPMSDRGLVLLGTVAYYMGDTEKVGTVLRNLDNTPQVGPDQTMHWGKSPDECWRWWQDGVETTAKVLDLKMLTQPESLQIPYMVDWLVDQRRGAEWKSTKDSAEVTKTLIRYLVNYPELSNPMVVTYMLNEASGAMTVDPQAYENPDETAELSANGLLEGDNTLTLTRYSGTGPIFYTVALEYYTEAEDIPAVQGSVTLERNYYIIERYKKKGRMEERRVPLDRPLKTGEELEVEIKINSPYDFDYVMLEDPRPAGCIYTETESGYHWWINGYVELRTEKRVVFFEKLRRGETKFSYRLKAEVPGDYAALPASIMGMYSPDIGSNTASKRIEVIE
jgi:uncharacterized protein YfaS (alpha-2-macroglobulin family)